MLIIFDCDGVLIDSERILNEIFRESLGRIGLELTLEETITHFKGRANDDCLRIAEELLGSSINAEEVIEHFERESLARFEKEIRAIPGIQEALEKLPHPKCVASSSSHEHIFSGLEQTELMPFFKREHVFSASQVERGKPAPDLFLFAANNLGVSPSECVVIEDSPAGIEGARAAGMKVLGYVDLTAEEELVAAGASPFSDMRELPLLLKDLF